jgi:hypothetical protein
MNYLQGPDSLALWGDVFSPHKKACPERGTVTRAGSGLSHRQNSIHTGVVRGSGVFLPPEPGPGPKATCVTVPMLFRVIPVWWLTAYKGLLQTWSLIQFSQPPVRKVISSLLCNSKKKFKKGYVDFLNIVHLVNATAMHQIQVPKLYVVSRILYVCVWWFFSE